MTNKPREYYRFLIMEMIEDGILDQEQVIIAFINYMTDANIGEMMKLNGFLPDQELEDDEIEPDLEWEEFK